MIAELIAAVPRPAAAWPSRAACRKRGVSSAAMSWPPRRRPRDRQRRRPCCWPTTWPPACPAPRKPCTAAPSTPTRRRSSPTPPGCWTRPARPLPRRWSCRHRRRRRRGRSAPRSPVRSSPSTPRPPGRGGNERRKDARVELWREDAGTAAVCGRDLPPADALAADQRITAYARELRAAGLDGTMDQLRARAFLDFTLGVSSFPPPASGPGEEDPASPGGPAASAGDGAGPSPGRPGPATGIAPERQSGDDPDSSAATARRQATPARSAPAAMTPAPVTRAPLIQPARAGPPPRPRRRPAGARLNRSGRADQPDHPAGHAARPGRPARGSPRARPHRSGPGPHPGRLGRHEPSHGVVYHRNRPGRPPHRPRLRSAGAPGPQKQGHRRGREPGRPRFRAATRPRPARPARPWPVAAAHPRPGGRDYMIDIGPLAVTDCDHRDESAGYQPSDRLRHLVEIRDGECTYPALPPPGARLRLRACGALRPRRPDLRLQRGGALPASSSR